MKTFKQFREDNQYVSEGAGAIIGGAFKLGSKALAAYSAYKAGDSLLKGKPKEAAERPPPIFLTGLGILFINFLKGIIIPRLYQTNPDSYLK